MSPTKKERGLIKGALRRVFSRSDLRRSALDASIITHSDPERPRVKKWCKCHNCKNPLAAYQADVDHVYPVVPLDKTLDDMTWDEVVNRLWCDRMHLQILCKTCHDSKSKDERKSRNLFKKGNKK